MCISSNWVNDAQDSIAVKKFRDFPNSLIPSSHVTLHSEGNLGFMIAWVTVGHLGVTVGHFRATAGHFRVIKGPLRVRN